MTLIRPIGVGELPTFALTANHPDHVADQAGYIERLIGIGSMRPEWCYLAEQAGIPIARFAFWTLPKVGTPEAIVLLDVASDVAERAVVAEALLARAIADALSTNTSELGHVIDEPAQAPQWQTDPEQRAAWLEAAGFRVARATCAARSPGRPVRSVRWASSGTGGDAEPTTSAINAFGTLSRAGDALSAKSRLFASTSSTIQRTSSLLPTTPPATSRIRLRNRSWASIEWPSVMSSMPRSSRVISGSCSSGRRAFMCAIVQARRDAYVVTAWVSHRCGRAPR